MENEKNLEETQEEVTPVEETAEQPAAEEAAAAEAPSAAAEETVPVEETTASEASAAEEVPAAAEEEPKQEEKKATPGKIALVIGAIVVVIAVIIALLMGGSEIPPAADPAPATTEATEPAPTIPADGNPDDETCKGTYTVTDEEVIANADTVVATIGEHQLTNSQLQSFYWMQVQSFLSSEYGNYMMAYGVLDYTQPLDMQICAMTGTGTWQQFFLKEALNTWQNYCALADKANAAGMELTEEEQAILDNLEANLTLTAQQYGMESMDVLLAHNVGAGAGLEDYRYFQELLINGNKYYDAEVAKLDPTAEEVKAFYDAHEAQYAESGITADGKFVDVRHVLLVPEGGATDETGATVYTDAEWAACEAKAEELMNAWSKGECDEESFAVMAAAYSQDPGSQSNGGLYQNVQQGQMVPEFDAWCFDEKREPGHFGMVKTTYGYHLMYFVGSTPTWEYYSRQDLIAEKTGELMDAITAEYPMEVDYSAISLGYVNMAG